MAMNRRWMGNQCGGADHLRASRREFMRVGVLGTLGLTLGDWFRLRAEGADAAGPVKEGPAKSVIQIFLPGGLAHQESFDPKLYAPVEYRGPLGTVKTKINGVYFSEGLGRTAEVADQLTIVRSMTHGEAAHERGTHNMMTGNRPSPALEYPSLGAVVSHELGPRKNLPPYVAIPNLPAYGGTGYLGSAYGAFSLGSEPENGGFQVRDLNLPQGIDDARFARRRDLRAAVDEHFSKLEKADVLEGMDAFYDRAYQLISSPEARAAFALQDEPAKLRDEYGRNAAGQRLLLARRLVEAGVRFVTLTYGGWDHHDNIRGGVQGQLPQFDQAFAALIRDLNSRGLLASTLVLVTTEFGRTPKINSTAGRDHWPKVFSIVMAGAGMKRGYVHGSSDATGAEPDQNPLTVEDFAATVFTQIGIDPEKRLMAPGGRPQKIVTGSGQVEKELLA